MKNRILYCLWAVFYVICFILGCILNPGAGQATAMTLMSFVFFVPGGILLFNALRSKDSKTLLVLRWISGLSLGLTFVMLIANFLSVNASQAAGDALFYILNFVSVPMVCCQHFVSSLFLWACIFFCTLPKKKAT